MPEIQSRQALITKADNGEFSFQASSEKVDSYGDIVVQKGIDLTRFQENPIILYQHDANEPIGKAVNVRMGEKGIIADVQLAPKGVSPKIDTIRGLIEAGILKAVSIGFSPKEYEPIRDKDNQVTGWKFVKSLLHEISVVSIPANDEALAIARSFKLPDTELKDVFSDLTAYDRQMQNRNYVEMLKLRKSHVYSRQN